MAFAKRKASDAPLTIEQQRLETRETVARLQRMETELANAAAAAYAANPAQPETDGKAMTRRVAELLLAGVDVLEKPADPRGRMLALNERLAAVREAQDIAVRRLTVLTAERQEEVEREFLPLWREHIGKVVALVDGLRELATERRRLLDGYERTTGFRPKPPAADEADELIGLTDSFNPGKIFADSAAGRFLEAARLAEG